MTFYSRTTDIIDRMLDEVWNYIIYLRKSRSDSPLESVEEVLERHEKMLQEFAIRTFGQPIPEENIFREVVSGETIADRPEMKNILSRIESKNIKGVIVVEPQRLSRGDLVDCGNIIRAFKYTGTKVLTPTKTYDLHERYDEKYFKDELMRGSDYLEYTKEILNRGRLQSVAEGWFIGSIAPYGYDKIMVRDGHKDRPTLKINEEEANAVRIIFDMYANQNITPHTIAIKLEEMGIVPRKAKNFSQHTVKDIIQNPHYIGKVVWNRHKTEINYVDGEIVKSRPRHKEFLIFEGRHPAIIDDELWERAQERRGKNPKTTYGRGLRNPLARLLFCQCGRSMSYRTYMNKGVERCAPRLLCQNQTRCGTRSTTFDAMMEAVIAGLEQHLEDFEVKLKNGEGEVTKLQEERLIHIQKELEEIEAQQEKLFGFLERGIYDEETFVKRNKTLTDKREDLRITYNKMKSTLPNSINYEDKVVRLSQAIEALKDDELDAKVKNDFLTAVVEKIVYTSHGAEKTFGKGRKRIRGGKWDESTFSIDIFLRV